MSYRIARLRAENWKRNLSATKHKYWPLDRNVPCLNYHFSFW